VWANIDPTACNISGGKKLTWMAKANLNWHGLASPPTMVCLFFSVCSEGRQSFTNDGKLAQRTPKFHELNN
jgi:hypothetical protein